MLEGIVQQVTYVYPDAKFAPGPTDYSVWARVQPDKDWDAVKDDDEYQPVSIDDEAKAFLRHCQ